MYAHLSNIGLIPRQPMLEVDQVEVVVQTNFRDIKGPEHVKRALDREIIFGCPVLDTFVIRNYPKIRQFIFLHFL